MSSSLERGRKGGGEAEEAQKGGMKKKQEARSGNKVIGRKVESDPSKRVVGVKSGRKEREEESSSSSYLSFHKKKTALNRKKAPLVPRPESSSPQQQQQQQQQQQTQKEIECPLCLEPLDGFESSSFFPCLVCSFQLCLFCFHRIRIESSTAENDLLSNVVERIQRRRCSENGQDGSSQDSNQEGERTTLGECPGCRTPYPRDIDAHIQDLKHKRREEEEKVLSSSLPRVTSHETSHEQTGQERGVTSHETSHEQTGEERGVTSHETSHEQTGEGKERGVTSHEGKGEKGRRKERKSDLEQSVDNGRRGGGGKYQQRRSQDCDWKEKEEKRMGRISERRREERKQDTGEQEARVDSSFNDSLKENRESYERRKKEGDERRKKESDERRKRESDERRKKQEVNGANHSLFKEESSFQEKEERRRQGKSHPHHPHGQERGGRIFVGMNGHGHHGHGHHGHGHHGQGHHGQGHGESVGRVDTRTRNFLPGAVTQYHRHDHHQFRRFGNSFSYPFSPPSFQKEKEEEEEEERRRRRMERPSPQEKSEERVEGGGRGRRKESCSFSSTSGQGEKGGKEYSSSGMLFDLNLHHHQEEKKERRGEEGMNGMKGEERRKDGKKEEERREEEEEEGKNCKEELIGILSRIGISNVSFRSSNHSFPSSSSSSCVKREERERMKEKEEKNESFSRKPETVSKP